MKINKENILFMIGCINSNKSLIDDYFDKFKDKDLARRNLIEMKKFISTMDPFLVTLLKFITNSQNISSIKVFRICREVIFESVSYEIEDNINDISFLIVKNQIFSNISKHHGNRNGIMYDINKFLSHENTYGITEICNDKQMANLFRVVCEIFSDTKHGLTKLIQANKNELKKQKLHNLYKGNPDEQDEQRD